ncbi:13100_t:CDS:2, partial [Gigaspora margarita]
MKEESNYPQSLLIKLFDKDRTFYYKIIKKGTYPPSNQYYYTKYSKYPIPNNYIVKTQYDKAKHLTKFQSFKSATYAACQYYKELNKIKAQTNTKRTNMNNKISKISGPLLFGLTLLSVKNICQTLPLNYNSKFHPFEDLSILTKRRKVLKIAHQVLNTVEEEKENIFYSNDNIKIKRIQFEIRDEQFDIYFGKFDEKSKNKRKEAIVKSLDCERITREAYRSLARIEYEISCEDILQPIVFEESEDTPDITDKNIVTNMLELIRKGGQNVGRKVKHVMVTMILLNDLAGLQKSDNHHILVLYPEQVEKTIWQAKILDEMKQLKVAFQFWNEKNNNNLSYTSLMGPDKLKILQNFNLTKVFQSTTRAVQVQNLWNQFYELYNLMQDKKTTERVFRAKVQHWLTFFLAPSQGEPNKSNFIQGMYRIQDITPYIHILVNHIPEFLDIHNNFGLAAFSCSAIEKKIIYKFVDCLKYEKPKSMLAPMALALDLDIVNINAR